MIKDVQITWLRELKELCANEYLITQQWAWIHRGFGEHTRALYTFLSAVPLIFILFYIMHTFWKLALLRDVSEMFQMFHVSE